jgi:molecular chaperone HtpG
MQRANKSSSPFKAGMYLLDSFTSGMYNDPLIVYREYIQNAVDSIDVVRGNGATSLEVRILLEPKTRTITISDNAMGVPAAVAEEVLGAIGSSDKAENGLRGFRGIGRLGGIAFCDLAVFRTKAKNEPVESIQEWDCRTLRNLLAAQKKNR